MVAERVRIQTMHLGSKAAPEKPIRSQVSGCAQTDGV